MTDNYIIVIIIISIFIENAKLCGPYALVNVLLSKLRTWNLTQKIYRQYNTKLENNVIKMSFRHETYVSIYNFITTKVFDTLYVHSFVWKKKKNTHIRVVDKIV